MKSKLQITTAADREKRTLLCLPGSFMSPSIFNHTSMPADFQIIPISWSTSAGPWDLEELSKRVLALIDELGLKEVYIAGHSAGGVIAQLAALHDAGKVKGLLLSSTGASTVGHGDPNLPERIQKQWSEQLRKDFIVQCFHTLPDEAYMEHLTTYARNCNVSAIVEAAASLRRIDVTADIAAIQCPAVIVHGFYDNRRNMDHALTLKKRIPDSEMVLLNTGHTPMVEDRKAWNAAVTRLLEKSK